MKRQKNTNINNLGLLEPAKSPLPNKLKQCMPKFVGGSCLLSLLKLQRLLVSFTVEVSPRRTAVIWPSNQILMDSWLGVLA